MLKKNFFLIFFIVFSTIIIHPDENIKKIIIQINPGEQYSHSFGILKFTPQIAIWAEDQDGNYIDTIYVTYKSAKSKWGGFRTRRPGALPVWSHKRGVRYKDGFYMPTGDRPLPDSITGATPDKSFRKEWKVPTRYNKKNIVIRVEVNKSFDYNDTYKKNLPKDNKYYNDVNGQPSVVFESRIDLAKNENAKLRVIGHGEVNGLNGEIDPDLSNLTSCLTIIDSIIASVEE